MPTREGMPTWLPGTVALVFFLVIPGVVALATLVVMFWAAIEDKWGVVGVTVPILLVEAFLLPRMAGLYELAGRNLRLRGSLIQLPGTTQPPPGQAQIPPPTPPDTTPHGSDQQE